MGGKDCTFEATAETPEELKKKVWAHAESDHADMIANMSEEQKAELGAKLDAAIAAQGG